MKNKRIFKLFIFFLITFFVCIFVFAEKKVYFDLVGSQYLELNIGEKYQETGYKALLCNPYLKFFCKNISNGVSISKNVSDDKIFLNYILNYESSNKILTREIVYKDKESPVIELDSDNIELCPNQEYIESGYSAYDNVDGDITDKVINYVKHNKIYYTVSDSSGNNKVVFRNINYIDKEVPVISLQGQNTVYIFKDREYTEAGYTAYDNCDGNIINKVIVENNIDIHTVGEYKITYSVNDSFGNKVIKERNVIVYDDYSDIPKNGKIVYLTFDDGPGPYTEDILNVLDKYNVKATFFVTNQFSDYTNLIKTEFEKGHSIAVHTYSHNYKNIYKSVENYMNDFNNINQVIYEQTGIYSKIFRFPGGSSNTISKFNRGIMTELANKLNEMGYKYFDWNIDSMDTSDKDPKKIAENVTSLLDKEQYSVVLMHDIKSANIESVDMIISYGLENGYTFLPLDTNSPLIQHKINN